MRKRNFLIWLLVSLFLVACTEEPPTRTSINPNLPRPSTPQPTEPATPDTQGFVPPTFLPLPTVDTGRTPAPNPEHNLTFSNLLQFSSLASDPISATWVGKISTKNKAADGKVEPIQAVTFSPDLNWLVIADRAEIWLLEIATGQTVQRLLARAPESDDRGANSLAWSPDGKYLAAGGMKGVITIWRWEASTNRFRAGGTPFAASPIAEVAGDTVEVAFSADSKMLAGFGSDGQITVYDANTGRITGSFTSDFAGYLSWSPDSTRLVDDFLFIHNRVITQSLPVAEAIFNLGDGPQGVAWSPDGKIIAVSGDAFELWLYAAPADEKTGITQSLKRVPVRDVPNSPTSQKTMPHLREGRRVIWSPGGKFVAVANTPQPGHFSVWNNAGDWLFTIEAAQEPLQSLAWPVEGLLASAGNTGEAQFWQLVAPELPTPTPPAPESTPSTPPPTESPRP